MSGRNGLRRAARVSIASGATLVVIGASRLLLLTKLDRYESSSAGWILPALRTALAGLESDYATLFARHTAATPA